MIVVADEFPLISMLPATVISESALIVVADVLLADGDVAADRSEVASVDGCCRRIAGDGDFVTRGSSESTLMVVVDVLSVISIRRRPS